VSGQAIWWIVISLIAAFRIWAVASGIFASAFAQERQARAAYRSAQLQIEEAERNYASFLAANPLTTQGASKA